MSQYFYPIILNKENYRKEDNNINKIVVALNGNDYNYDGLLKIMEHSYIGNSLVGAFETLINKESGDYANHPIVWAGEYADNEGCKEDDYYDMEIDGVNLFELVESYHFLINIPSKHYRYIINETTKEFVDTNKCRADEYDIKIHPLPLLTCEYCDNGLRDSLEDGEMVGVWARNVVVVSDNEPSSEYKELKVSFFEK